MAPLPTLPEWVALEHEVQRILSIKNNMDGTLMKALHGNLHLLSEKNLEKLKNYYATGTLSLRGSEFTPKRDNRTQGYVKGASLTRLKELNCSSRDHISWILQTFHGWNPTNTTPTGKPIIDEVTLKEIGTEVATMFLRILTITKMLGMIIRRRERLAEACYEV